MLLAASQAPLLAQPYYADGDPGPIVAALAQVPELLVVATPFIATALGPTGIDWRTKEIVIVRTSALAGCQYCLQSHTVAALDAGLSHPEVSALRGEASAEVSFSCPAERALLRWIDAVAGGTGPIDESQRAAVRRHWADHEVVELTTVIGVTLMLNRFATALALPTNTATQDRLAAEGLL